MDRSSRVRLEANVLEVTQFLKIWDNFWIATDLVIAYSREVDVVLNTAYVQFSKLQNLKFW